MTGSVPATEAALAASLPPWRDFAAVTAAPAGTVPAELVFSFEHRMHGWLGRTLVLTHRFDGPAHRVEFGSTDPSPRLVVLTTFEAFFDWRAGRCSTLELLEASGRPPEATKWSDLLVAHGLAQLVLQPGLARLGPPSGELVAWARRNATAPAGSDVAALVEADPCPA